MSLSLATEPYLRDRPLPGGRIERAWQGQLNAAGVGVEVAEVTLEQNPTPARMRAA